MRSSARFGSIAALSILTTAAACSGRLANSFDGLDADAGAVDGVGAPGPDAGIETSPNNGHTHPSSPPPEPSAPLSPSCDEDNPVTNEALGGDRPLPDSILQFQRRYSWGCIHREWHETQVWDLLENGGERFATRWAYVQKKGWKRARVQEGQPTNGLDFLAMHRAMLGTLRANFPEHAKLLAGWTTAPTSSTPEDPLPEVPDGGVRSPFSANMLDAIDLITDGLSSFASDDEFGIWVQSQIRPTPEDPFGRSADPTAGLHTYYHVRYDDRRSAIRMQRFNRNIENQVFWRLHGWIDDVWSRYRKSKNAVDERDKTYLEFMNGACVHMGFARWELARSTCTR